MRLLAACAVLLTVTAHAQQWREINTPPTRRDMNSTYRWVAALDRLDDTARWTAASHGQSARASVSLGAGHAAQSHALHVRYEFSGRDGLEYVDIAGSMPLPAEAKAIGLWVRGSADPLPVNVRVADAHGEVFQYALGALPVGEWAVRVCSLDHPSGHWGGDNNGQRDLPLRVVSLIFDRLASRYRAQGELQAAELGDYQPLPGRLQPHGIKITLPATQTSLVYEPGQTLRLRVSHDPADPTVGSGPLSLAARLVDPFGRLLHESRHSLPTDLSLPALEPGAFDLQLRLTGREEDLDAPWADFRFAVLPLPTAQDITSPFGVSTHFVGWDYARLMPLLARAGLKHYRDELYWSQVEQAKDKLAIPDRWQAYLKLGQQLGLEPLIIVDYTNKLWEPEGDFPVHPESRAAFARYAAFLARECAQVRNWEIWNEWCGGCGMNGRQGNAADYAPLFLESARAIREVNPAATVAGIGGEWDWAQFGPMMSQGAGAAMDAATIHPYMYPGLPARPFAEHLQRAQTEAQAAAGKPLPVWITEIGWPTQMDARGSSFLHQARALVRMLVTALACDIQRIFWYDFKDDGTDLAYNENNFGLVHHDSYGFAPKPAYVAYAHLIRAVQGRNCQGWGAADAPRSVSFRSNTDTVTVLWTEGSNERMPYRLPARARVEDMFGQPIKASPAITITQDPVFVITPR